MTTAPGVRMSARATARHLCPVVDEVDVGDLRAEWTTTTVTAELHSLAALVCGFTDQRITHEELVSVVANDLTAAGCDAVTVTATFTTAGLNVTATAGRSPA